MKIDKQAQKNCILLIKDIAKNDGYRKNQNTIYKIINDNIIFVDFLIVNSEYLIYRINIKKYSFDDIFWKIMKMEENIKKGIVLRVNGAFAAPAVSIAEGKVELLEDVNISVKNFYEIINREVNNFLNKYNVVQYIFSANEMIDANILQCLSYMDSNLTTKAKELAEKQILLGDKGRFKNEGKGFFELVLLYND